MPYIILGTEDTVVNKREKSLPLWGFSGETTTATTKEAEYPVGWIKYMCQKTF